MSAVSNPRGVIAGAMLLGIVATGLVVVPAPAATAAEKPASEISVTWVGDSSAAKEFQPKRNTQSPHYPEFEDLSVSVSQVTGLTDQAIRVSVDGFSAGTVSDPTFGQNVKNYVQAMQCWGDDPTAADFRETCQWGGRGDPSGANTGVGTSVYADNVLRVAPIDNNGYEPTDFDVPFRTVDGTTVPGKASLYDPDGEGPKPKVERYPILDFFGPSTTNEVTSARIGSDGAGFFDFEVQTSDQAPQLGCGREDHLRCWLVVVPRGTVFGGDGAECSSILNPATDKPYANHRPDSFQGGSPINPKCDYWDNRVVVPLDFNELGSGCEIGSKEQRVIGSQLMVGAMSSWQPSLCSTLSTTFSFSTNPDAIAREQLLEGLAPMAFTGYPLASGQLDTAEERDVLAKSKLVYAPVAVSGVAVAYISETNSGRQESLTLTPRLMAKLLTQSYRFLVPSNSADPDKNVAHLPAKNLSYRFLYQDPDFKQANPTNYQSFTNTPAVVLPGPSSADAISQVWKWILADREAVAFLNGEPDPWGMSINPYYLPAGNANAKVPTFDSTTGDYVYDSAGAVVTRPVGLRNIDDTPQKLSSTPLDIFVKADESTVPIKLSGERNRFDTLQFAPYTESLLSGARVAFRANPNSKTVWDPNKINLAGEVGDWVSSGGQVPGQKFMITITDTPSALRYGLSIASLRTPNSTSVVAPDAAGLAGAMKGLAPTSLDSVLQVDPAQVPETGYPLTMVTYAGVNLTTSTPATRAASAGMITQVTTGGQTSGSDLGKLPAGYLPITPDMTKQALAAVAEIQGFVDATTPGTTPKPLSSNPPAGRGQDTFEAGDGGGAGSEGTDPAFSAADEAGDGRTPTSAVSPIVASGLGIGLVIGLAGFLFAPILFRGRPFL